MRLLRLKNQVIAWVLTRFPSLSKKLIASYNPWESEDVPWSPVRKPLQDSKVAIVTTSGIHHKDQKPFDMNDTDGDPTSRSIDTTRPLMDLMITHDYYDHSDADKDINIVFPIERLWELESERAIENIADTHFSFMGHIDGPHIHTLINKSAPEVARKLQSDEVDVVLLTPG